MVLGEEKYLPSKHVGKRLSAVTGCLDRRLGSGCQLKQEKKSEGEFLECQASLPAGGVPENRRGGWLKRIPCRVRVSK